VLAKIKAARKMGTRGILEPPAGAGGPAQLRADVADRTAGSRLQAIADFRKDNGPAIRATCRRFIDLCRRLDLFTHAVVAIDGSKLVNARDKNFTKPS
jgi:transposase